jgi:hypothetical protein
MAQISKQNHLGFRSLYIFSKYVQLYSEKALCKWGLRKCHHGKYSSGETGMMLYSPPVSKAVLVKLQVPNVWE